jgi:hypothetical protein
MRVSFATCPGEHPTLASGKAVTNTGGPPSPSAVCAASSGLYDNSGEFVVEPGRIDVSAGNSSSADMVQSFEVR